MVATFQQEDFPLILKRNSRAASIPDYVDTLDGFRAFATILVLIFHYWQQSWVSMVLNVGPISIDFTPIVSIGSLGVELLFVLSGFCLYYPLAMHPEKRLHIGQYAYKRFVRILPTYFLCVIVASLYQIGRMDPATLHEQFIGNMTLTQMTTPALAYNQLNGVLWSIAIEAQFYVLFPILLKLFKKKPYWVMAAAFAIGETWRWYLRDVDHSQINWLMNQLPGMIDVYIGGMLAAHIAAQLKRTLTDDQQRDLRPVFTIAAIMFFMVYILVTMYIYPLRYRDLPDNLSRIQMHTRKFVLIAFSGSVCCSVLSCRWMHLLLGNPVTRFVSTISYQVYMWHMWLALRLKDFRIPEYATERPMDDPAWRWPYMVVCCILSFLAAVFMTYCVERPISKFCMDHAPRWAKPKKRRKKVVREVPNEG